MIRNVFFLIRLAVLGLAAYGGYMAYHTFNFSFVQ